jgi:pyrophosphatase PpaX
MARIGQGSAERVVVFDLDGTLIDSKQSVVDCVTHTLQELGLSLRPETRIAEELNGTLPEILARILAEGGDPATVERVRVRYREHYRAFAEESVVPFPGTVDMLQALHARGLRCAIATSKGRESGQRLLQRFELNRWIEVLMAVEDVRDPKPNPEALHSIVKRLNLVLPEVLMVGDSAADMECGRNYGAVTCAVTYGFFPEAELRKMAPDHLVHTPFEIVSVVDRMRDS